MKKVLFAFAAILLVLFIANIMWSDSMRRRSSEVAVEVEQTFDRSAQDLQDEPATQGSDLQEAALYFAIQDEYKAESTYGEVIKKFGDIRPFSNIINAEVRHSEAIAALFKKRDIPVPTPMPNNDQTFDTIAAACAFGVKSEEENIALYERLLSTVKDPDIVAVFKNNMQASQLNHLPAFGRCAR